MLVGSKEWLDKYANEYREYLQNWADVFKLNSAGDYSQGWATTNPNGDYVIRFDL